MLNLDVCEKCIVKRNSLASGILRNVILDTGTIVCTGNGKVLIDVDIYKPPPEHCPYRLEHAVSAGMEDA